MRLHRRKDYGCQAVCQRDLRVIYTRSMDAGRRAAALLEVLGIYLAGQLGVSLLTRAFNVQVVNPLNGFTVGITDAELVTATHQMLVLLMLQYAGWFMLIIPINWWHRRGPAAYGLTKAGRSWTGAATDRP